MRKDLKVLNNLISAPDENGKVKMIKRNLVTIRNIDVDHIIGYEQTYNNKGIILKNQCLLYLTDNQMVVVKHSFEYIEKLKKNEKGKIGFKY